MISKQTSFQNSISICRMIYIFKTTLLNRNIFKLLHHKIRKKTLKTQRNYTPFHSKKNNTILYSITTSNNKNKQKIKLKKSKKTKSSWNNGAFKTQLLLRLYVGKRKERRKWKENKQSKIWLLPKGWRDLKWCINERILLDSFWNLI